MVEGGRRLPTRLFPLLLGPWMTVVLRMTHQPLTTSPVHQPSRTALHWWMRWPPTAKPGASARPACEQLPACLPARLPAFSLDQ